MVNRPVQQRASLSSSTRGLRCSRFRRVALCHREGIRRTLVGKDQEEGWQENLWRASVTVCECSLPHEYHTILTRSPTSSNFQYLKNCFLYFKQNTIMHSYCSTIMAWVWVCGKCRQEESQGRLMRVAGFLPPVHLPEVQRAPQTAETVCM